MNIINDHSDKYGSDRKHPRGFWARLMFVKKLISRLVNLVSVTQQDLVDAGVQLRHMRD